MQEVEGDEWAMPALSEVMNGRKGVVRGRGFDLVDDLYGSLEW